jgi:hypothetical protein
MKKVKCVITNIDWDTDGEVIEDLPKDITFEMDYDDDYGAELDMDVADELSDRYGFCINSFYSAYYDEDGFVLDAYGERESE